MKFEKSDIALLITRIMLAIVIFAHGAQKLFGWFGGYGFNGTMQYFTQSVGLPYLIALLIILAESFGAIALALGLFGRFVSASIIIIMFGAIFIAHAQFGFYVNWFGNQQGEGYEFHLLAIALSVSILIQGSGALSADALLSQFFKKRATKNLASV